MIVLNRQVRETERDRGKWSESERDGEGRGREGRKESAPRRNAVRGLPSSLPPVSLPLTHSLVLALFLCHSPVRSQALASSAPLSPSAFSMHTQSVGRELLGRGWERGEGKDLDKDGTIPCGLLLDCLEGFRASGNIKSGQNGP